MTPCSFIFKKIRVCMPSRVPLVAKQLRCATRALSRPRPLRDKNANDEEPFGSTKQSSGARKHGDKMPVAARAAPAPAAMKDEYGAMDADGETFTVDAYALESGIRLVRPQVRYRTYGAFNAQRDNCVVVCHALTGNAALDSWWGDMLGPGKLFDTQRYLIVCLNVLGSCYGTTGPTSINPATGLRYGASFPDVTVRDSVGLHILAVRDGIKARSVLAVIGGSLGGMQALEWAAMAGSYVKTVIAMCCGASHSPWQIGISETQRQAIYADAKWRGGDYPPDDGPASGLSVARQVAMITYRSHQAYLEKFGRELVADEPAGHGQERFHDVERYLRHQGVKFPARFDALSYVKLTRLMDTHDVGRGRGGVARALQSLQQPTLVLSVSSDALYPPEEQEQLARGLPHVEYRVIASNAGHDGFLLEQALVEFFSKSFLRRFAPVVELPSVCAGDQQHKQQQQQQRAML